MQPGTSHDVAKGMPLDHVTEFMRKNGKDDVLVVGKGDKLVEQHHIISRQRECVWSD